MKCDSSFAFCVYSISLDAQGVGLVQARLNAGGKSVQGGQVEINCSGVLACSNSDNFTLFSTILGGPGTASIYCEVGGVAVLLNAVCKADLIGVGP